MHLIKLFLFFALFFAGDFTLALAYAPPPELTQAIKHVDNAPAEALNLLLPIISTARETRDSQTEATALRYAGTAYHRMGNPDEAATFLQSSLTVARLSGYLREEGDSLNSFGIYCFDIGMYEQSLRYFLQALAIRKQTDDTIGIARTTNNLGLVQNKIGNYDQAIDYFRQSLNLKETAAEINGQIISLNNMGLAYKGKNDLNQALLLYQQALALCQRTDYPEGLGYAHQNMAEAYRRLGLLDRSLEHCQLALVAYRSVQYLPRLSYAAFETALTYHSLKNYPAAWQFYKEALDLASQQNQQELIRDITRQLAILYEEQGDLLNSLTYYKRYFLLKDELASAYIREKILILDAEHRSARQLAEITLLKQTVELNQTKLHQQYLVVLGLSLLSAIALCSMVYFRRQIKIRRANELELHAITKKLKQANSRLNLLATTDSLTKIANRRRFDELYPLECARAQENGQDITLLLIDIDFFKQYNDFFGHLSGDRCLRQLSGLMRRSLADTAYWPARYGGEEFALVLYQANLTEALRIAETLRQAIEDLDLSHPLSPLGRITVSLGVASATSCDSYQPETLFKAADEALYRAKEGGRNQVRQ